MNLYYKIFSELIEKYEDDFDGVKEVLLKFYDHKKIMSTSTINQYLIDIEKAIQAEKFFLDKDDILYLHILVDIFMNELYNLCIKMEYYEVCQNILSCSFVPQNVT